MRKYFGTDGIRGEVNVPPLTADFTLKLGRAAALNVLNNNKDDKNTQRKILVGKDTRISSYMLENALVAGICSAGVDAVMVGVLPTPAIAFMTKSIRADAGVVISASHNPYYDNGIKFFDKNGYKLADSVELEIEELIDSTTPVKSDQHIGKAFRIETAIGRYVEFVKQTFPKAYTLRGIRIVTDLANGAGYKDCPMALEELGAEVIVLNNEPNGTNINKSCGAVYPENMSDMVLKYKADIGISLDGDADRVIFSDSLGNIIDGDKIMGICAKDMLLDGTLKNDTIVATVMSNLGFEKSMNDAGIKLIRSSVGDRYVVEEMLKSGSNLGGEQSGHIIFSDFNPTGDGIISALQLLKVMRRTGKTLTELASTITLYPQILKNVLVKEKVPLEKMVKTSTLINDIKHRLDKRGRILVRYSGTENKLRVMIEGERQGQIESYAEEIITSINEEIATTTND